MAKVDRSYLIGDILSLRNVKFTVDHSTVAYNQDYKVHTANLNQGLSWFGRKSLSVIRCWKNGATLSDDNLETSWTGSKLKCVRHSLL